MQSSSRSYPFATLDVFTDSRFAGNPLAVVLDADGLDDAAMQAIAREFNLSETTFVSKPERPGHSARVRIFTPAMELPFAGHPTVGTAIYLAERQRTDDAGLNALIVLEEAIGTVRVGVRFREGVAPFAEFDAPKLPVDQGEPASREHLADALGLMPSEIGFANHKPSKFSAGVPFMFVPVASLDAVRRAQPDLRSWTAAFGQSGKIAPYVYTRNGEHTTSSFHARMFDPPAGIPEDPATGSAAAAFAAVVAKFDRPPAGWHKRIIEQGFEMGRPSLITLSLEMSGAALETVRIGGNAVIVSEGTLRV